MSDQRERQSDNEHNPEGNFRTVLESLVDEGRVEGIRLAASDLEDIHFEWAPWDPEPMALSWDKAIAGMVLSHFTGRLIEMTIMLGPICKLVDLPRRQHATWSRADEVQDWIETGNELWKLLNRNSEPSTKWFLAGDDSELGLAADLIVPMDLSRDALTDVLERGFQRIRRSHTLWVIDLWGRSLTSSSTENERRIRSRYDLAKGFLGTPRSDQNDFELARLKRVE